MKILWVTNVILPKIETMQGKKNTSVFGGWLSGISNSLINSKNTELKVCYPNNGKEVLKGSDNNFSYCSLPMKNNEYVNVFENNLSEFNPDVIHFFGTEFGWSYELLKVCQKNNKLDNTIISIQGLVSECAEHYFSNIPFLWRYAFTMSELYSRSFLQHNYHDYKKRGLSEKKEILLTKNLIGRTTWDRACVKSINDSVNYYFCNETLRNEFYTDQWKYENCKKHSIYFSQGAKPLKGLHILIKALAIVAKKYPDVTVCVTGSNIINGNWVKGSTYGLYIKRLICKYKLENTIKFVGILKAQQVKERLLNSNIFVSCSSIENSPNSLGEAMLLGVPCVSSDVGGVVDMITHNLEGYVYPYDEHQLLAHYIIDLFDNVENARKFSDRARTRALKTHNQNINNAALMEIYNQLSNNISAYEQEDEELNVD